MLNIMPILEWSGTIFALTGSAIMAQNGRYIKVLHAWVLWLLCNVCYILYFINFEQNGLLLMNIGGLIINSFGFYQWLSTHDKINKKITTFLLTLSSTFFIVAIYSFFKFIYIYISYKSGMYEHLNSSNGIPLMIAKELIAQAEWFGSMLGLSAAFLLSARHRYSFLCWFLWSASNFSLLLMAIFTPYITNGAISAQYGFAVLQAGFSIINIYGCYSWFKAVQFQNKLKNI